MKHTGRLTVFILLLSVVPCVYLAAIWKNIPATVPLHFGLNMQADRIGDKTQMILPTALFVVVTLCVYFLLVNLHRIDPKRVKMQDSSRYEKLATGISVFMTIMNFIVILSCVRGPIVMKHVLFPLLGLLLAFIGNYMHTIKPNYFAGMRLPWTLSDDENWRKTHLVAGKLWFWCGIAFALSSLFIPAQFCLFIFIPFIVIITLIPATYSYWLFKQKNQAGS